MTSGLTANINIDNDTGTTTLTLAGPSDKWFGIGFGNSNMNGTDIFMTNGSSIRDAYSTSNGQPQADSSTNESGDWTLVSNTVSSGTRTIVATRANDTGNSNDYTFSASAGSLTVIWAVGASSTTYASGHSIRGATALSVSLGISENNLLSFEMYPNPVSDLLNIQLPTGTEKAEVGVFDYTGRLVSSKTISSNDTAIDVQQISKGIYMIRVAANNKIGVQRFIKK